MLLELYADGELSGADLTKAEELIESDASAREYLEALKEMNWLVSAPIEHAAEQVNFDGLFARIEGAIATSERTSEMDALAVAFADGELHDAGELARVEAYIAAHSEVSDAVEGMREFSQLVRVPIEMAADKVDFSALARRIDRAIDAEVAATEVEAAPVKASFFARFTGMLGANRAVFASALTAAAVVMVMLPFTAPDSAQTDPVEIHNYYYQTAETVGYEWDGLDKGFEGTFQPEDKDNDIAPVLWIAPEGSADSWEKESEDAPSGGSGSL
ncbi:MAG: anti-sigma factor RsiW [Bradymonadia bacterium]|jgi:anti-sigma factor RsiW